APAVSPASGSGGTQFADRFYPRPTGVVVYPGWGWASLLLPYLEQAALGNQLIRNVNVEDPANWPARGTILRVYTCPSDRSTGVFPVLEELTGKPLGDAATNSYAACYGDWGPVLEQPGSGLFCRNSQYSMKDVPDGLSTTLAIGERAALFAQ